MIFRRFYDFKNVFIFFVAKCYSKNVMSNRIRIIDMKWSIKRFFNQFIGHWSRYRQPWRIIWFNFSSEISMYKSNNSSFFVFVLDKRMSFAVNFVVYFDPKIYSGNSDITQILISSYLPDKSDSFASIWIKILVINLSEAMRIFWIAFLDLYFENKIHR